MDLVAGQHFELFSYLSTKKHFLFLNCVKIKGVVSVF